MSADNGIYILQTIDPPDRDRSNRWPESYHDDDGFEYRVAEIFAFDNIAYYQKLGQHALEKYLGECYSKSYLVFHSKTDALIKAEKLQNELKTKEQNNNKITTVELIGIVKH